LRSFCHSQVKGVWRAETGTGQLAREHSWGLTGALELWLEIS
jgi:hypothetical protein